MRQVVQAAIEGTKQVQSQHTTPDADWKPFLLAVKGDGRGTVVPIHARSEGEALAQVAIACKMLEATEAVVVMSAWTLVTTPEEEAVRTHALKDDPARSESIIITYAGRDAEPELHVARVDRWEHQPPTLGEYRLVASGPDAGGHMVEAMLAGMDSVME